MKKISSVRSPSYLLSLCLYLSLSHMDECTLIVSNIQKQLNEANLMKIFTLAANGTPETIEVITTEMEECYIARITFGSAHMV